MNALNRSDLQFALRRLPRQLVELVKEKAWSGKIFIGGGFLRSVVQGEFVNDIDVFVSHAKDALEVARLLVERKEPRIRAACESDDEVTAFFKHRIYKTDNALTLTRFTPTIQIIHRWLFEKGPDVANSFDFSCCCAVIWFEDGEWQSYCDENFYPDVAAKRLRYRSPVRNEDAGGSLLRVLKYYQKEYRMPLDSLAAVIARMLEVGVDENRVQRLMQRLKVSHENVMTRVILKLLREVDPLIDPSHAAHLPTEEETKFALPDENESES